MSNIVSKIRQRIALKDKNKFDLSCDHFTTGDFMQLSPVFIQEMVPGESINVKEQVFTRLAPLVKPMYGRARIEVRKFFVPMRTIMRGWNEYITDTTVDGVIPSLPTLALHNIAAALTGTAFSTSVTSSATVYDYVVGSGSNAVKYRFTPLGKVAWKILNSLGYKFPIGYWVSNTSVTNSTDRVSALPLLAYIKIYSDWYKNQAYNDATFFGLFESVGSTSLDNVDKLRTIFTRVTTVCYDKDELFVSAWDRPNTPNDGLNSSNFLTDVSSDATGNYSSVVTNASSAGGTPTTPVIQGKNASTQNAAVAPYNLSQYCIDALKSLTDYLKRHQIAGGLAMDRMMARFGMKPSDAALKRSIYLGKNSVDIQIADVMATANGQDGSDQSSALGDYAGKGVGYNDGGISYKTDEYGYLIFCASIIPSAHYVQGMQPQVFRGLNGRLDFWTPEFDGIGVDALPRKMVLADYNGYSAETKLNSLTYAAAMDGVFGFVPRYAAYKASFDNLTGDFVVPSLNAGNSNDVWHLNRMFEASAVTIDDISHNLNFVCGTDSGQFDRIFAVQEGDTNVVNRLDHFYTIYHFEVESWKPMRKLFDDYDFDGGKDVTLEVNGTQLN